MKKTTLSKPNAFIGKKNKPTPTELREALGQAKELWDQILSDLHDDCPKLEWSSYSLKAGWALKLKRKDRTILYMGPLKDGFRVTFVLGEKAIRAAGEAGLSKELLALIAESPKYPEGTGVRFEPTTASDVETIRKLAAIKIAN